MSGLLTSERPIEGKSARVAATGGRSVVVGRGVTARERDADPVRPSSYRSGRRSSTAVTDPIAGRSRRRDDGRSEGHGALDDRENVTVGSEHRGRSRRTGTGRVREPRRGGEREQRRRERSGRCGVGKDGTRRRVRERRALRSPASGDPGEFCEKYPLDSPSGSDTWWSGYGVKTQRTKSAAVGRSSAKHVEPSAGTASSAQSSSDPTTVIEWYA